MLNVREELTELYHQKLENIDLGKVKDFVKRNANGPVTRSVLSWIADDITTLVNLAVSPIIHPDGRIVNLYESHKIPKGLMDQFGNVTGLLTHNLLVGAPSMYSIPSGLYFIEHLTKKGLENYKNDSDGKMAEVQRFLQKHITSVANNHLFSNFVLDFHSFLKYGIAVSNLDLLLQNSNLPKPWKEAVHYAMWSPYIASLVRYYWKKFDTTENLKKVKTKIGKELHRCLQRYERFN